MKKKILITGSAGFVGRHLAKRLKQDGHLVFGIDPIHNEKFEDAVQDIAGVQWDHIVHLGANIVDIDRRTKAGISCCHDITLDLKVCEYVQANPPKNCFLVMSSCASGYIEEPYGINKTVLEMFASLLYNRGVRLAVLRPYSGYGSDQSLDYPFPSILRRAVALEDPLTVWGATGTVRDWIHIDDLIEAIVVTLYSNFRSDKPIDIGTGLGTNMITLARSMAEAVGYNPSIEAIESKAAGENIRVAQTLDAVVNLKWGNIIGLREGIRMVLDDWNNG